MYNGDYYVYGDRIISANGNGDIENFAAFIFEADCISTVNVDDWVYIKSDGVVDGAIANNQVFAETRGIVIEKITSTRCKIQNGGIITLSGLNVGKTFFLSSTVKGAMQDSIPSGFNISVKRIGFSITSTLFVIDVSPLAIKRRGS